MPLYELMCDNCGYKKEEILKMTEQEPVCDMCRKPMKRIMSAPAFILKGKCWSRDNYGLHTNTKSKKGDKANGS